MQLDRIVKKNRAAGFTLVELIVVIAIMAVLASVAVGASLSMITRTRQNTLDRQAEQFYTAVSRQIQYLCSAGKLDQVSGTNSTKMTVTASNTFAGVYTGTYDAAFRDFYLKATGSTLPDRNAKYEVYLITNEDAENPDHLACYQALVGSGVVDGSLLEDDSRFCIFYAVDKQGGNYATILEAWYTTEEYADALEGTNYKWTDLIKRSRLAETKRTSLRQYNNRISLTDAHLGYYGITSSGHEEVSEAALPAITLDDPNVLTCWLNVKNAEELRVQLYCFVPGESTESFYSGRPAQTELSYTLSVQGAVSGQYGTLSGSGTFRTTDPAAAEHRDLTTGERLGYDYLIAEYTLDSLNTDGSFKSFVETLDQPWSRSGDRVTSPWKGTWVYGEDLRLELNVTCATNNARAAQRDTNDAWNAIQSTNSLFASAVHKNTHWAVEIAYGRHLQNLDPLVSGVNYPEVYYADSTSTMWKPSAIRAVQILPIYFNGMYNTGNYPSVFGRDSTVWDESVERWNEVYDVTGSSGTPRTFLPVNNAYLVSYECEDSCLIDDLTVTYRNLTGAAQAAYDQASTSYEQGAGLFGTFVGEALTNIQLVDPVVTGTSRTIHAGSLAGVVTEDVTITGCGVYMQKGDTHGREADASAANRVVAGGT